MKCHFFCKLFCSSELTPFEQFFSIREPCLMSPQDLNYKRFIRSLDCEWHGRTLLKIVIGVLQRLNLLVVDTTLILCELKGVLLSLGLECGAFWLKSQIEEHSSFL